MNAAFSSCSCSYAPTERLKLARNHSLRGGRTGSWPCCLPKDSSSSSSRSGSRHKACSVCQKDILQEASAQTQQCNRHTSTRRQLLGTAAIAAIGTLLPHECQAAIIDEDIAQAVFDRTSASVVSLMLYKSAGGSEITEGVGSGLIWDRLGHVVTNYHCISAVKLDKTGSQRIRVVFGEGTPSRQAFDATVVGADAQYDLAVLQIDAPQELLQPIPVGTSADLKVGQSAYAIGNPAGLTKSMSTGVISGLNRSIPAPTGTRIYGVIQTDTSINAGSSGGALLDSFGRLVGISTATFTRSGTGRGSGVNFALPVDLVRDVVPNVIVYPGGARRQQAEPAVLPAEGPSPRDRHL